jgi:diacylglycerol kinase (ATP)
MRLLLVHNPKAGDETHDREHLEALLTDAGHDVVYRSVKDEDWRDALHERPELVVAAGGDGTVCEVVETLVHQPLPVTLLPLGSANNIARTLGYPSDDAERLIQSWTTVSRYPFDVWAAIQNGDAPRFVESMGGGIFADVLARAEDVKTESCDKVELGLRLLAEVLAEATEQVWELTLDDVTVSETLLAVEAMNIRELGPNIPLAPDADPGDGLLDVVLVRPEHRDPLSAYVQRRLAHEGGEPPNLDVRRVQYVKVRAPEGCRLRLDDELVDDDWHEGKDVSCGRTGWLELLVPLVTEALQPIP